MKRRRYVGGHQVTTADMRRAWVKDGGKCLKGGRSGKIEVWSRLGDRFMVMDVRVDADGVWGWLRGRMRRVKLQ